MDLLINSYCCPNFCMLFSQARQMERGVLATLWLNVDQLLASGSGVVDKAVS
jgi:hypothetical protein